MKGGEIEMEQSEKKEKNLIFWARFAVSGVLLALFSRIFRGMTAEWVLSIAFLLGLVGAIAVGLITKQGFWRVLVITSLLLIIVMIVAWSQLEFSKPYELLGLGVIGLTWVFVTIQWVISLIQKKTT